MPFKKPIRLQVVIWYHVIV